MGMAVAALGSVAGGMAAKAIMGEPNKIGPDTSIPGVTSAVLQKGGKANQELNAAQIDPTGAINYFKQAASDNANYVQQGLNLYNTSIAAAAQQINTSYGQANQTLSALSSASNSATNQYLRMLGIAPQSQVVSSGLQDSLSSLGGVYAKAASTIPGNEALTDPNQRIAAQQAFTKSLTAAGNTDIQNAQDQINAAQNALKGLGAAPTPEQYGTNADRVANIANIKNNPKLTDGPDSVAQVTAYQNALDAYNKQQQQLQQNLTAAQTNQAAAQQRQSQANQYAQQYQQQYTQNPDLGYTGQQASDIISNTPGYQFQLNQGLQAVQRAGSATGNLASGNTLTALNNYAQGQASTYYQNYMNNLNTIAQNGIQATVQTANNQTAQGNNLANLYTMAGNAASAAYNNIGAQYANSDTNAGQAYYNAAQYNATAQNQVLAQKRQNDAQMAQQAVQSGPFYMNASTNQQQLQYGVFQGQQAGQAYGSAMSGSNTASSGAGTGYPYYNQTTGRWQT